MNRFRLLGSILTAMTLSSTALADEGMWLLNAPIPGLAKNHGFAPDAAWMEHVQKASVRFNNGGSGSFVSADGLIITNHHVASDAIYKLSDATHNYLQNGFLATTRADEIKCVDLELNVLMAIEDVTDQINAAVTSGMSAADAFAARRSAKAAIEKASLEKTGLRSDIVTLYQGARYHLYCYKKYTDVRLVFAPEQQAAFFGGDPDNFEYPRYNLDCTFLRAYENGQPAKIAHYFKWSSSGVSDGELVFVSGHPGSTSRLLTLAELESHRDLRNPNAARYLKHREVMLASYSARSPENARIAKDDLFGIQNSRKVYDGRIAALLDPAIWARKRAAEQALLIFSKDNPDFADVPAAFADIAAAQKALDAISVRSSAIEGYGLNSQLFGIARTIVRHATEISKPNGDRLREFRDSNLASLELGLFSEEPIYPEFEIAKISSNLGYIAPLLGTGDASFKTMLGGKAPAERATELVKHTQLLSVPYRKKLYGMSPADLSKLDDPMIALAVALDAEGRALRKIGEEKREVIEQAHARIAKARFAMNGTAVYPDATFTLRLSFGKVKGYEENGTEVAPFTDLGGKFRRCEMMGGREPFDLPVSWVRSKDRLALATPYNFVSTCDIIGGNSGSPTLNRNAEFVGIIFDGNIQSLVADYAYSDAQSRALSVDARGIIEALRAVYKADSLIKELLP